MKQLAWILVVAVLGGGAPARAGSGELEFTKGVLAFSQGDLAAAEAHFGAVLSAQPDHAQAAYYLAQVVLSQGQNQRAVELFRRAGALMPQNRALQLDLALALVKAARFAEAERELLVAEADLRDRASFQYYLGYCRYRQGRFQDALLPLTLARDQDQGFAASAGYYLALTHARLGQIEQATSEFEGLARTGEGSGFATLARENLVTLTREPHLAGGRRLAAYASTGFGYDSNVTLDPTDTSGAGSARAFIAVGGTGLVLKLSRDELELAASLFRSFHLREAATGFNLTDLAAAARYRHRFEAGSLLELGYGFDLDLLDGGGKAADLVGLGELGIYMEGHRATLRLTLAERGAAQTSLDYQFRASFFSGLVSERDNLSHELFARERFLLARGKVLLTAEAGVGWQDAKRAWWNSWSLLGRLDLRVRLSGPLVVLGQLGLRRQDFYASTGYWQTDKARADVGFAATAGFQWLLTGHLTLGLSYSFLRNESLPAFTYNRHLVNLSLTGTL